MGERAERDTRWVDGRLRRVRDDGTLGATCLHGVGLTAGLWCGACMDLDPRVLPEPPVTADHTPERLSAEWIRPKPDPFGCYDCGLPYGQSGWCDAHVPNDVWARISPTGHEGGVLCITCMARRCETLGLDNVPLIIGSGPWLYDPERARLDGLRQGREQALDSLAAHLADAEARLAAVEALLTQWRHDLLTNPPTSMRDLGWVQGVEEALGQIEAALHPAPSEQPAQGGDDT